MRREKRNKGSFGSALLLGLIFGISLVVCQELIYESRLMAQYSENPNPAALAIYNMPPSAAPDVTSAETPNPEPPAESDEPEFAGIDTPAGYFYDDGSDLTAIQIGDEFIALNFNDLKEQNQDFVGWFLIPGTTISYPVVQGKDNAFYLEHIFNGNYSKIGTIFADFRNVMLADENTILYGHNLMREDGLMFTNLVKYAHQDFYDEHPTACYLTEEGGYTIKFFSAYEASTSDMVYTLTFATTGDFEIFLEHAAAMSAIKANVELSSDDKVITLSTCSNVDSNGRFVLIGKIVPF